MEILSRGGSWRLKILRGIITAGFVLLSCQHAQAQESMQLFKQKIEAGLIYNFLKYTTWPSLISEKSILHVCLYGEDAFDGYLYPLNGRTAQQHVINISQVNTLEDLKDCQLVFIPEDQESLLQQILSYTKGKNILTVSDISDFTKNGGMVEFSSKEDQRIHLLLNKSMIEAAGLRIEDRILRLAEPGAGK